MYLSAYGLRIASSAHIPGLPRLPNSPEPDVRIWLQSAPRLAGGGEASTPAAWYVSSSQDDDGEPALRIWKLDEEGFFRFRYSDGTEFFLAESGDEVWARWPDSSTPEDTATYLLGPVFGFLLRLRGMTCLHASAVAIGGRAIALVGAAGAGKSTAAAAFARLGHPVLSEDVVALSDLGDSLLVQPGYPLIRLWPESVRALYGVEDALPPLTPNWDKRCLDLTRNGFRFQRQPLPLAAVYVLDRRSDEPVAPFVESLTSQSGLITLVANTYANYLLDREMRAKEFELLGRLVKSLPLRRLTPHSDPARLPELCRLVLDDFSLIS